MRPRASILVLIIAAVLSTGACSSSNSSPTSPSTSGTSTAAVGAVDISGTWDGTLERINSGGDRTPVKQTFTFSDVQNGVFKFSKQFTLGGKEISLQGLGSVAPNGSILASDTGESDVFTGYVVDENTIVLQAVEFQEIGQEITNTASVYAGVIVLTRR